MLPQKVLAGTSFKSHGAAGSESFLYISSVMRPLKTNGSVRGVLASAPSLPKVGFLIFPSITYQSLPAVGSLRTVIEAIVSFSTACMSLRTSSSCVCPPPAPRGSDTRNTTAQIISSHTKYGLFGSLENPEFLSLLSI